MSRELGFIILLTAGPLLWMLGGTFWKGFRRYVLPVVILFVLLAISVEWWRAIVCAATTLGANHIGYGDNHDWLDRVLAFSLAGIGAVAISLAWYWPALTLAAGLVGMEISKKVNWFTWKVVEAMIGFAQAGVIVLAVTRG